MSALEKRRAEVPDEVTQFLRLPGLGPEDGSADLARARRDDARRAARGGRAAAGPGAPGPRREERGADPRGAREGPRAGARAPRACSATGLPVVRDVVAALREHPAAVDVSGAGSVRRGKETFRDLDVIATATDPAALTRALRHAAVGARGRRARRHEGDGRHEAGAAARPARRPARGLRQPAPALHRLEGSQRRAPRGRAAPRASPSPSTASRSSRRARCTASRPRTSSTASSATTSIPPELRENGGELAAARDGTAAGARRARRPHRRAPLSLDVVVGRQVVDRGDGARREGARQPVPRRSPTTRTTSATAGWRRQWEEIERGQRARQAVPRAARGRGEHPRRRLGRRRRRGARRARLGRRLAPRGVRPQPDRARRSPRSTTRTSTASATSPAASSTAGRARRSTSSGSSRARPRRARRSRSTASPTGSTCATSTRASPARRACASRSPPTRTRRRRSRYRELGVAQARRAWLTKEQILNTRSWREIAKLRK